MKIGKYRVGLVKRTEPIKGCWSYWEVELEDPEGNLTRGEIQSDGHEVAKETLVDENGNRIQDIYPQCVMSLFEDLRTAKPKGKYFMYEMDMSKEKFMALKPLVDPEDAHSYFKKAEEFGERFFIFDNIQGLSGSAGFAFTNKDTKRDLLFTIMLS